MKTLNLQKLLHWAFVDELVKGGGEDGLNSPFSAWASMDNMAQLGIRVDRDRAACDVPMFVEQGEPHADALLVGRALQSVMDLEFKISSCDGLLSDWPEAERLLAAPFYQDVVRRYQSRTQKEIGKSVVAQVITNAILNRNPCFDAPVPKVDLVKKENNPCWFMKVTKTNELGRQVEIEVDGFNNRSRRPYANAYRKYALSDNPQGDIMARIDYQFWVKALNHIFLTLNGNMQDHQLSNFSLRIAPWMQKNFYNKNNTLNAI